MVGFSGGVELVAGFGGDCFDACWVCLMVGFDDGCFGGWVSVVVRFYLGWW